ncbi:hypothetical protein [Anaeromicrobium sediminis]|uniref:DUF3566 domain-containing protein n=1 Tax=Anaeromicrobium sediminis TaxID=1478221 RepID=A0A267MJX5_9FIRM|nr:hypothetical protein [Anaeromicrobium sediminis]PAB59185.1 hypothetical protein CCE28_11745 [Anaeromicrobium sediminis]
MKSTIEIRKISFGSFIKLFLFVFFSLGITIGILLFIMSLFGGNVYANIGPLRLTGIMAGVTNIFLVPLLTILISIIYSLTAYIPFKLINSYIFKGIKLTGDFTFIEENKNDTDQLEE